MCTAGPWQQMHCQHKVRLCLIYTWWAFFRANEVEAQNYNATTVKILQQILKHAGPQ